MTVAALFFRNVFGAAVERALSVFVSLRYVSYSYIPVLLYRHCLFTLPMPKFDDAVR